MTALEPPASHLSSEAGCRAREAGGSSAHLDFKRPWLVWCRGEWMPVVDGRCGGCGADVTDRVKGSA